MLNTVMTGRWSKSVSRHWYRRSPLSVLLLPFAGLYALAVLARHRLYRYGVLRSLRLPVPVVVVGNFTIGGTGKTPLVIWLVARLREAGFRPGVVSRGYGRVSPEVAAVFAQGNAERFGDEPLLIAERTGAPVWVGHDRVAAGRALLKAHPDVDVIVCDDGLQHLRLQRDVEIAVSDRRGWGNGFLIPAGPLREPIRRVDARVHNGATVEKKEECNERRFDMTLAPRGFYFIHTPDTTTTPDTLSKQRLHAVAGIGAPERFFDQLQAMGLATTNHPFPDHHRFVARDLDFTDCDLVLMTEKDAVKCRRFDRDDLVALRVEAQVDRRLCALILEKLRGRSPA